jgi:hypothetical protein
MSKNYLCNYRFKVKFKDVELTLPKYVTSNNRQNLN